LGLFFGPPKKSSLQPARYEAFTKGAKTGRLYDRRGFASDPASGHFLRNLLRVNLFGLKSARIKGRQNLVTYNNMAFAKREKRGLVGDVSFS
jgi:hypothetical protein